MVVSMRSWINVERGSQASVALLSQAFVVAFDLGSRRLGVGAAGKASNFLLAETTRTCNFGPARACCRFVAWRLTMATALAPMLTKHLDFATKLAALSTFKRRVLTVSWSMAQLLAKM